MPALPRLKTDLFRELASRLRYVPQETAFRQLRQAEALAREVFNDLYAGGSDTGRTNDRTNRMYPGAWIIGRITGYEGGRVKARGAADDPSVAASDAGGEDSVILGSALLADLCAMIEHLSVAARVRAIDPTSPDTAHLEPRAEPAHQRPQPRRRPAPAHGDGAGADAPSGNRQVPDAAPWLNVEDLCVRWRVSRKSLERWRGKGLWARRVTGRSAARAPTALGRLIYAPDMVERFELVFGLGPKEQTSRRARGENRLDEVARTRVVLLAERCHARFGWNTTAISRRLAARFGCSTETIRRIIRSHERRTGRKIIAARTPLGAGARAELAVSWTKGARARTLAADQGISRASVYRIAWDDRLERLVSTDRRVWNESQGGVRGRSHQIISPVFERDDAEEVLLGAGAVATGLRPDWPTSASELLREARTQPAPDAHAEQQRAAAYRYLLWRSHVEIRALASLSTTSRAAKARTPGRGPRAGVGAKGGLARRVEQIETWLTWASRLKCELVRSQLGLIVRTIDVSLGEQAAESGQRGQPARARAASIEAIGDERAREVINVALAAAIDGVERFDPFQGGRLAAPVGLAVGRAVGRWVAAHGDRAARKGAPPLPLPATGRSVGASEGRPLLDDLAARMHPWQAWIEPPPGTRERTRQLPPDDPARRVMEMRWGWTADGAHPRSAAEVGFALGMRPMRVRTIERRALRLLTPT